MKGRGSNAGAATEGPHRRASASDADGASTEQIDSAFAEIKKQLVSMAKIITYNFMAAIFYTGTYENKAHC